MNPEFRARLRAAALELAVEDFYGLWEIAGRARSLLPETLTSEAVFLMTSEVRALIEEGLVILYRQNAETAAEAMNSTEAVGTISDPHVWESPSVSSVRYLLASTDSGDRAYYEGS